MKKNAILKFREEDHTYWRGKKKFKSVNKFLADFGFFFDKEYWSVHKAIESVYKDFYRRYFSKGFDFEKRKPTSEQLAKAFESELQKDGHCLGELIASILDEWDESSRLGTEFHNKEEDKAYENGFIINPFDGKKYTIQEKPKLSKVWDNISTLNFLKDLKDGSYVELLLFSLEHEVAGQADEVFIETIDNVRYVDIGDHKTNKKKPKNTNKYGTCYFPIDHLNDCTYVKYWLQVSMYAHLLERLGYTPRNVGFYHYKNYDVKTKKVYSLPYLGKECDDMLYHYLDNISN